MNNIHTPERLANESFEDYKARREESNQISKANSKIGIGGRSTRKTERNILRNEGRMKYVAGLFGLSLRNWITDKQAAAMA